MFDFFSEFVTDDFREICAALGVDVDQIYWSGFCSQGDGACFTGSYRYVKGAAAALKAHAPNDSDLHRIADGLQELQRRNFYRLSASIRYVGRYCHENSVRIRVFRDGVDFDCGDLEDLLRDLMRWLYRALEQEYAYQQARDAGAQYRDKRRELLEQGRALVEMARDLRAAFQARHNAARDAVTLESMSLACFGLDAGALAAEARRQQAHDENEIRELVERVRAARDEYRDARHEIRRVDAAPRSWRADHWNAANYGAFWEGYDNAH